MKVKNILITTLSVGVALLLTGCGQSVAENNVQTHKNAEVSIQNCSVDQKYKVSPERIVALGPGQADLIGKLGAGNTIVGIAQLNGEKIPGSLTEQGHNPQVLSENTPPSREQLLQANPDLVLSPTTYEFNDQQGYASQEQLTQAGAANYVAAAGCLDRRSNAQVTDLFTDIDAYGKILGKEEQAQKLRQKAQKQLDEAAKHAKGKEAPTVAQLYIEGNSVTAIGAGIEHDIAKSAGAQGVFNPKDPEFKEFFAAEVSREAILKKNPQAIIFTTTSKEHEESSRKWLKENLSEIKAVKENRIIAIPASDMLPGTWGNLDAVTAINKALYQ